VRQSLTAQVDAALGLGSVTMTSRPAAPLSFEHFVVVFLHECRSYNVFRAFFASLMRFVGFLLSLPVPFFFFLFFLLVLNSYNIPARFGRRLHR
jgi:hypothetical protein